MFTRWGFVTCVVAAALIAPGVAAASESSPGSSDGSSALYQYATSKPGDSGSAVDQYGEKVPTSTGGKAVGSGGKTTTLPANVSKSLSSVDASTREKLGKVVSSTGSDVPRGKVTLGKIPGDQDESSFAHALGATLVSAGAGSTARLVVLLAAVIGISVAIGVTAVRKQRI